MGMYGDALNKLDDGLYVKLDPSRPVRLRILAHPRVSQQRWVDQASGEVSVSTRFTWPVWDYDQQRIRILEQGKSIFKAVAAAVESWDDGEAMPSPFDIKITRKGTGKNDTEYTVTPLPHLGTMPALKEIEVPEGFKEKLDKGTPLKEMIEQGVKPAQIEAGSAKESAGEPDVIVTDLDENKEINIDEIPF